MDSVIFQAMAVELGRKLANSRLDRVIQVSAGTLVLKLWTGREKAQLLLKADGRGCFYQTRQAHAAPAAPPRFCQLLRARLRRLLEIRAEPLDRIAHFIFSGPANERYDLILEAFGAQGNLILTDASGRIVDLLWRQDAARLLLPGEPYHLPVQTPRLSLFGAREGLVALVDMAADPQTLSRLEIAPMSPALARAICTEKAAGRSAAAIVAQLQDAFSAARFAPVLVTWDDQSGMLPLALGVGGFATIEESADLSRLLEAGQAKEEHEPVKDLAGRLASVLDKQRKKLGKRVEHILAERLRQSDPEPLRIMGELLLANLRRIKRGDISVAVDDYYQSPVVKLDIPLDAKHSPQENAERYFKLYRKARRAGDHHQRRLEETEQELAWLGEVELALAEAQNGDDLYQVQLELEASGLLKAIKGQLGRRPAPSPEDQLHQSVSPAGLKVFWGKNSRTNDYVSRQLTGANDLWFHAHNLPGCHLVLKCAGHAGPVPEVDILYAASLAAGYSKGKEAGKVEVLVAQGRDVKKPKGARPGLVTVESYRTVMVAPRRQTEG